MNFKKSIFWIIALGIIIIGCGSGNKFFVKGTENPDTVIRLGNANLGITALYESNFGIKLIITTNADQTVSLYPYSIKIEQNGEKLIYDIMRNQRLVRENPIKVGQSVQYIGFSCNDNFELMKGDEIMVYGENFIKDGDRLYNLDTLYFELK